MRSTFKYEGETVVHQSILMASESVGYANIKIYGRDLSNITKSAETAKFNRGKDIQLIYLCGDPNGYDGTENGFIITPETFIGLLTYIVRNRGMQGLKPIRLMNHEVRQLIKYIRTFEEDDIIGEIQGKHETLNNWLDELERIVSENKVALFLEIYEI